MDARTFLGLRPSSDRFRWSMEVTPGLVTGKDFLFGGCGLAAGIVALEGTSGRPCVWAAAQYLSFARTDERVDVDVTLAAVGRQITQGRAVAHVGAREILTVNAALGARPAAQKAQWETMPDAIPQPPRCAPPTEGTAHGIVNDRIDLRFVAGDRDGTPGGGRTMAWARIPEVIEGVDAAALGILGDFVPKGIGRAMGNWGGGTSLDNTLRVARLVPTQWVLLDIRVHALHHGFGHGLVHMFAEDGTLLATASQSCVARFRPVEGTTLP
jgi:acyl-CoA thioesterase-2